MPKNSADIDANVLKDMVLHCEKKVFLPDLIKVGVNQRICLY